MKEAVTNCTTLVGQIKTRSQGATPTHSSGIDSAQLDINIGTVVLQILLDLLLSYGSRRRR